jgi:hypothetical protein
MLQHAFNTRLLRAHVKVTSARMRTLGTFINTLFTETPQNGAFACTSRAHRAHVEITSARNERALKWISGDLTGVRAHRAHRAHVLPP